MKEISASQKVFDVRRFGTSSCVKVDFEGDSLLSHVKAGLIRSPVRSFVLAINAAAVGHVVGICNKAEMCSCCGGSHDACSCTSVSAKYVNCHGDHNAKTTSSHQSSVESYTQTSIV